jgi:hypothetical protein
LDFHEFQSLARLELCETSKPYLRSSFFKTGMAAMANITRSLRLGL